MKKPPKTDHELNAAQMDFTRALTKAGFKYFIFHEYDNEIHLEHKGYKVVLTFKKIK